MHCRVYVLFVFCLDDKCKILIFCQHFEKSNFKKTNFENFYFEKPNFEKSNVLF